MKLRYSYILGKCEICGREILIEIFRFGVSHTANVQINCKECLKKKNNIPKEFIKQHPEEAKVIQEWLNK